MAQTKLTDVPLFVFVCDPDATGDPDDAIMLRAARRLHLDGAIEILAVVHAPVAIGADIAPETHIEEEVETRFQSGPVLGDGYELLRWAFALAERPVNLVLTAPFTDIARVLADPADARLVLHRVAHVTVMGRVTADAGGWVQDSAFNNNADPEAAARLYAWLQSSGEPPHAIPQARVVPRETVYRHLVPVSVLDEIAASDNEIGAWLAQRALAQVQRMWRSVNLEPGDPRRSQLAPDRTRESFLRELCGAARTTRTGEDSVRDLVLGCPIYDLVAFLEALRAARGEPELVSVEYDPRSRQFGVCRPNPANAAAVDEQLVALVRAGLLDWRGWKR